MFGFVSCIFKIVFCLQGGGRWCFTQVTHIHLALMFQTWWFGLLESNFHVLNTFSSIFAVNFSTSVCHSLLSVFYHYLNGRHPVQLERFHATVGSDCKLCNSQVPFVHTVALRKYFISPKENFKTATNTSCLVLLKMTPGTWHMNEDWQVHPVCN